MSAAEQLEQSADKDEEGDEDEYTVGSSETDDEDWSDDSDESEESDESEKEEKEPVLKYKRFAKEVVNALQQGQDGDSKNVIQCTAVHRKFIALGTDDGTVRLLDHSGTVLKDREYNVHSASVNQISIDEDGEFIACCSDDGKVSIIGLSISQHDTVMPFDRPQKSVAIHPQFNKVTPRVFVTGSDKVLWVEPGEKRWLLFGTKSHELQSGYGIVSIMRWRNNYLAWANEKGVFVYDTALKYIITYVSYEEESPVTLPCSLCWARVGTLLVGRGHLVKVAEVKDSEAANISDLMLRKPKKHIAITCQNVFPEYLVCGVVPIQDGSQWNMVVLGYDAKVDQTIATKEGKVPAPHLVVIPPGKYNQEKEEFNQPNEVTNDKLLPRGYAFCHCKEYHLECVSTGDEDKFYVLTPIDIIQAQKRDANDHVEWLLKKEKFSDAVNFAENPDNLRLLAPGKREHAGLMYIYHLIKTGHFYEAARKCHDFLGPNDGQRWEDVMYSFMEHGQLPAILPFIPKKEPKLNEPVYEMVLNHFLFNNTLTLHQLIVDWPSDLYNTRVIMNAVKDRLKSDPDNQNLLKVKAKLHEDMEEPDKALEMYLRLGDMEVLDLIRKRRLHTVLLENLRYLMKLGEEHVEKTVELLVDFRISDCIPPIRVVRKLESFKNEQNREYFLHRYLDTLFDRDPKAGSEFHQIQVELYADYDRKKLLPFLRACDDIPLQKALEVCESRELYDGMVFLLDRMGNPKASLEIIVGKLYDLNQAIQFVRERDDEELWVTFIQLSKNIPGFLLKTLPEFSESSKNLHLLESEDQQDISREYSHGEMTAAEVNRLQAKIRELDREKATTMDRSQQLQEDYQISQSQIIAYKKQMDISKKELEEEKKKVEEEKKRVEEKQLSIDGLNSQLRLLSHEMERTVSRADRLQNDLERIATQCIELERSNFQLKQESKQATTIKTVEDLDKGKERGRGCFGAVYEVRVNGVPCIAKRLHDILVGRGGQEPVGAEQRAGAIDKFKKECHLLGNLRHPNVVQFMGVHYGHDEADISLIMEYMHMDLDHCMKTYPNFPLSYKTRILRDVAYGLAYLHSIPIIHCDLNAGNVLLTESLRAKIADLGVAKLFDREVAMKRTRTVCPGAPDFMSPESLSWSPKYSDKLDVFSFGHLAIYLVNQEAPHVEDSTILARDVKNKQMQVGKRRRSLDQMGGSRHPFYATVVQCLSDTPDQRPTSRELVRRMEQTCQQFPIPHKNTLELQK